MNEIITFEQLPTMVTMLSKEVSELKNLITKQQGQKNSPVQEERFMSIQEASEFLNLSVATLYTKVSKSELPYCKRGKRLYFLQAELVEYVKQGKKKTNAEIDEIASAYIANNKNGLNNGK